MKKPCPLVAGLVQASDMPALIRTKAGGGSLTVNMREMESLSPSLSVIVGDGQTDGVSTRSFITVIRVLRTGHSTVTEIPGPRSYVAITISGLIGETAVQVSAV